MINYTEKTIHLHNAILEAGHYLAQVDGVWVSSDDVAVQAIIDSFDPLPYIRKEWVDKVNDAAGKARVKYTTNIPFQEAAYQLKEADVRRYKSDGYPADTTNYPFTQAEVDATGLTPQQAADAIIAQADQWTGLMILIEKIRRKAIIDINAETDWNLIPTVAQAAISQLEVL